MTVTAPPRPPRQSDPVDRQELEALVEALIEEARQRAQRRRRIYWAAAAVVALVAVVLFTVLERVAQSQTASPALTARLSLPAASPSSKIAFTSQPRGGPQPRSDGLYVVNADGSGKRRLTPTAWIATPAWSPDGRKIAFVGHGLGNVYVMNADGSGQRRLMRNAAAPSWSPDGRKIAFLGPGGLYPGGRDWEIYVMNADGSGERRLTRIAALDGGTAWSPDGRKIAFVAERDGNFEVDVVSADGSGQQRLTRNGARNFAPAWSPDGQMIAFERRLGRRHYGNPRCSKCGRASIFEVYVMNADGSGQRRLTQRGAQPLWSPDGRRIAFVSERDGNAEVYVMNADGSGQRNLTRSRLGDEGSFAWSPGQKK